MRPANELRLRARPRARRGWVALLLCLAVVAWSWLTPPPAQAGVGFPAYPLGSIRQEINTMPGLTPAQRANWRAVMLPAARRGLRSGLDPWLVTDLARVALRRGSNPWTYSKLIDRLIRVSLRGGDPRRAARRLVLRYYYGPGHYRYSGYWYGPGVRGLAWVDAVRLRDNLDSWRGVPYYPGGRDYYGVDRCGLVQAVFRRYGLRLPRGLRAQSRYGVAVPRWDLRLGDLLFFRRPGYGLVHVGIYLGDGFFLHADPRSGRVHASHLDSRRFSRLLVQGRRVVALAPVDNRQAWLQP